MKTKPTRKQLAFVEAYCDETSPTYGNATASAGKAGYSPKWLSEQGYQLLNSPIVSKIVKARQEEASKRMHLYASRAIETLHRILVDPNASDNAKIQAARELLDRGGHTVVQKSEVAEVRVFDVTERARAILAERVASNMVNVTPPPVTIHAAQTDESTFVDITAESDAPDEVAQDN